jgi:hypothetical protein
MAQLQGLNLILKLSRKIAQKMLLKNGNFKKWHVKEVDSLSKFKELRKLIEKTL